MFFYNHLFLYNYVFFYNCVVSAAMMSDQYQGVLQKQSGAAVGGIHNVPNTTK